jgi:hypothetical protein
VPKCSLFHEVRFCKENAEKAPSILSFNLLGVLRSLRANAGDF